MAAPKYTEALLDEMRRLGDPPADGAIEALFDARQLDAVQQMMDQMITNDAVVPDEIPLQVKTFWQESQDVATVAANARSTVSEIAEGEAFFADHGPEIILVLGFYSLPIDYAGKGVRVLYDTGYLVTHPNRRLLETMQMVIDVMSPGGLSPGGRGITTALKVRLMHAAIRCLLRHGKGNVPGSGDPPRVYPLWNDSLGLPINQEDMAGTLMSFSLLVLDGLRKLGVDISPKEELAFMEGWRVVGTILGVSPQLIPGNIVEARELTEVITRRQVEPSEVSGIMIAKLLEMYRENVTGPIFRGVPPALMRLFLPKDIADKLGVPRSLFYGWMVRSIASVTAFTDWLLRSGTYRWLYRRFSIRFLQFMIDMNRGGSRANFAIPGELDQSWRVSPQFRRKTVMQSVRGYFGRQADLPQPRT